MSPNNLPIISASDRIKQLNNIDKVKRWQGSVYRIVTEIASRMLLSYCNQRVLLSKL